jgi:hypothetical protein
LLHLRSQTSPRTVHFVLFDDRALRAFQNVWDALKARGELDEPSSSAAASPA